MNLQFNISLPYWWKHFTVPFPSLHPWVWVTISHATCLYNRITSSHYKLYPENGDCIFCGVATQKTVTAVRTSNATLLLLLLLWLYSPLFGLGRFFSFLILYTVCSTSWTGDQPVARPLPTHRTTQSQNKRTQYRHPCLERDSNPRSQRSSERRRFMT
jgi:hypothetical protein